jgi:hypothetical protein
MTKISGLSSETLQERGPVDFMVVECHSCNNVGLLSARFEFIGQLISAAVLVGSGEFFRNPRPKKATPARAFPTVGRTSG